MTTNLRNALEVLRSAHSKIEDVLDGTAAPLTRDELNAAKEFLGTCANLVGVICADRDLDLGFDLDEFDAVTSPLLEACNRANAERTDEERTEAEVESAHALLTHLQRSFPMMQFVADQGGDRFELKVTGGHILITNADGEPELPRATDPLVLCSLYDADGEEVHIESVRREFIVTWILNMLADWEDVNDRAARRAADGSMNKQPVTDRGMVLVHQSTGEPVCIGERIADFRGQIRTVLGGSAPRHPAAEGYVHLDDNFSAFFAGVIGCGWRPE